MTAIKTESDISDTHGISPNNTVSFSTAGGKEVFLMSTDTGECYWGKGVTITEAAAAVSDCFTWSIEDQSNLKATSNKRVVDIATKLADHADENGSMSASEIRAYIDEQLSFDRIVNGS